ncbi:MAG TPA: T9SS type A sorting domain-containing protein [Ignavibacteria bacterium]|nr:T9SS type A sorting domain-containing protein [Ignavibacteria bacterium]
MKASLKLFSISAIIFLLANTNLFSQAVTVNGNVSQNYSDLTSAFDAINLGIHGNGSIQVLINQSHTLTSTASLHGGIFTACEIKPTADVIIEGNFGATLIILDGADRVTIDGRVGIVDTKRLTLTNTTNNFDCIVMKNGASDNVIKFAHINSSFYNGINISQSIPGSGGNNDIIIEDCNINGSVSSGGTGGVSGFTNGGTKILRNICLGIYMYPETRDIEIRNNKMNGLSVQSVGIIDITENKSYSNQIFINPVNLTSPGSNITEINISNNFFSVYVNYNCFGVNCYFEFAAFSFSTGNVSNITANINYNTITLRGIVSLLTGISIIKGWDILAINGNVSLKNNIVKSYVTGATSNISSNINALSGANLDIDFNCYYYFAVLNSFASTDINAYRAFAFPNEQHTIFKDVEFVDDISTGDLHLAGTSIGDNDLKGISIPGTATDIDNQLRVSPYMGADEADFPLPVELSSFTSSVTNNNVQLNWTTVSETNNSGFDVERSTVNGEWSMVNFVKGHGNSNTQQNYSYEDKNLSSGKYKYRLKQIDFNGNFEYYNLANEVVIGFPNKFSLSQNYPNPFNPSTVISYILPAEAVNSFVSLKIYDISGKEIRTLVSENQNAGRYEVKFDGSNLSSGVYFYKIEAGSLRGAREFTSVKKMMLMK